MTDDPIHVERDRSALILVDVQPDFLPGGALPVPDGHAIVDGVRHIMKSDLFGVQVATQDWHPPDHVSFATRHPGRNAMDVIRHHGHPQTLWPAHCVQGTPGAGLLPGLPWERVSLIVRKGEKRDIDAYSGFRDNWDAVGARAHTGLAGALSERGVDTLYVCGLARDVCVKWTAEDGADHGFHVVVVWDLTRPVDPSGNDRVRTELDAAGVRIAEAARLVG